jgi:polysaccharide export outer membrane protein
MSQRERIEEVGMSRVERMTRVLLLALGMMLAWSNGAFADDARLGVGDVVKISVYGQNDLNTTARIGEGGEITFPLIGQVVIGDMTATQAQDAIAALLSSRGFVRNPQVTLFVERRLSTERDALTILGQVKSPGRYPADSLSEGGAATIVGLLAMAGGVTDSAADRVILKREEGGVQKQQEIDLVALLEQGDVTQNQQLRPGDVVFVPAMDVVYVYGEVNRPGKFRLSRNMTVMQAIAVSGGLTPRASEKGLTVKRRAGAEIVTREVALTDALQADDVLHVKEALF